MIMSDREIDAALRNGFIQIEPRPSKERWTSTAVDLTLDGVLLKWTPKPNPTGQATSVRPMKFNVQQMMDDPNFATKVTIDPEHGYTLDPKSFILGFTKEAIQLPPSSRLAARVEGKSSLARVGVGVHVTAPTIHAGFGYDVDDPRRPGRPIQLEIFNLGVWPVVLDIGMPICQLIFEEVREVPSQGYIGQFSEQTTFTM